MKRMKKKGKVIISVGSFTIDDVRNLLESDDSCYIEAYEPREEVYQGYCNLAEEYPNRFTPSNKAVSGEFGKALLNKRTTKSTICPVSTDIPNPYRNRLIEVDVISMSSILERFNEIDELHINCEGSEIPIIMETDLELFRKCKYIKVQFHNFVPFLNITQEDTAKCATKLLECFELKVLKRKYGMHIFTRS